MTPLKLSGRALAIHGQNVPDRCVVRLSGCSERPATPNDVALVRSEHDVASAVACGYEIGVFVGAACVGQGGLATLIHVDEKFDHLSPGDIVGAKFKSQHLRVLFRAKSRHNSFLVTERCNHWCVMCSQPPRDVADDYLIDEIREAIQLLPKQVPAITFTGGEPLTNPEPFLGLLALMRDKHPETKVHVLTNGRKFANAAIARAWAGISHPNLMAGIPVYASVDHVHDYVVQSKGAFDETILGIMRLKDAGQRVEIRVVLHRVTIEHLIATCAWIAKNLSFVDHVALMGMENTGFAIANGAALWVDPDEYRKPLAESLKLLQQVGIPTSIYNLPLCVLDESCWSAAVQSISDWKNAYLPQCDSCDFRSRCAGFFSSGRPRHSEAIKPIRRVHDPV